MESICVLQERMENLKLLKNLGQSLRGRSQAKTLVIHMMSERLGAIWGLFLFGFGDNLFTNWKFQVHESKFLNESSCRPERRPFLDTRPQFG